MKLRGLDSRVRPLRPTIAVAPSASADWGRQRDDQPYRRWYKTARWQKLRMQVLQRDDFTCRCGCGVLEGDTSKLVADHIVPHRGDEALFWDERNLQTLRKSPCHDSMKQRAERRGRR